MKRFPLLLSLLLAVAVAPLVAYPDQPEGWPRRVLITNDNGIDDPKLVALARAFAPVAETYVVAPIENRSGSTNYALVLAGGQSLEVEPRDMGEGIVAYGVDGYPADCVLFGLMGLLRENPPDLVVSGINGGPNLGPAWIGSGTIGAARMAAFGGFPAIAVSGLDDDMALSVSATTQWVVQLAQSPLVRQLADGQYLTVSIPPKLPDEIEAVQVTRRAQLSESLELPRFQPAQETPASSARQVWQVIPPKQKQQLPEGTDVAAYSRNRIAIVPMRADEHDLELMKRLVQRFGELPAWPPRAGE